MAGGGGQRPSPTVSDILNGLPSGSSGRSSVSLNSLLSDYLMEMQQLAEGTLLPKGASEKGAQEKEARTACAGPGSEAMALEASTAPDILMQPLEFFPISSCNSWALPGLPTLHSLQRMSIGPAGGQADTWQSGPTIEWLAKIARPPTPSQELGGPKLPSLDAIREDDEHAGTPQASEAHRISSMFLQTQEQQQQSAAEMPALPEPSTSRPAESMGSHPLYASSMPASSALTFMAGTINGENPLLHAIQDLPVVQLPGSSMLKQEEGGGSGTQPPLLAMPRAGSEAIASPSGSHGCSSQERGGSQEPEPRGAKGKRSKEEIQQRNKAAQQRFRDRQKAKLKEAEDATGELAAKLDAVLEEKRQLELRLAEFARTLAERDELIAQLRAGKQAEPGQNAGRYTCNLPLTLYPGRQIVLTPKDIADLGRKDMVLLWKDYVSALSSLLPSNQGTPLSTSVMADVRRLAHEATALLLCVADSHPGMFKTLAACKLEIISNEFGEDSIQVWAAITRLLALTQEQRASLVQLRSICLKTLGTIIEERNSIHAFLTEAMPAAVGARHAAAQYLKAHEGIEQLKLNLKKEHDLKVDYMTAVWINVLKPEQVARAMVHAYPWLPDIMAVAAVVAAEEGDPEALSHLRADSSGGPGAFLQPQSPGHGAVASEPVPIAAQARQADHAVKRPPVATPFAAQSPPDGCIITSGRL